MKAISLWQPWAAAMRIGEKQIETRHWRTNYRGPLLIHAAKHWTDNQREIAAALIPGAQIHLGAIVAIGTLIGCSRTEDLRRVIGLTEFGWGDYSNNRYGWIFDQIRLLNPIPFKGKQGFFEVPDSVLGERVLNEYRKDLTESNRELFQRHYQGAWD